MSDRRDPLVVALAANAAAVVATVAVLVLLAPLFAAPPLADPGARLALAARLAVWPALVLLLQCLLVMGMRGHARALNPIDDPESRTHRICQRALTNTVEQTAVFVPALLALCAAVPVTATHWPAALTAVFVAGRLLFVAGYLAHPYARAPGMAMTLTVNMLTVGWALWEGLTASAWP